VELLHEVADSLVLGVGLLNQLKAQEGVQLGEFTLVCNGLYKNV